MDIIFIRPTRIEDCTKCVANIKENKMVHIDLGRIEPEKAQRILDYISGAVFMQDGQIVNPAENVFCTIPKGVTYTTDYKNTTPPVSDEEEEIVPVR